MTATFDDLVGECVRAVADGDARLAVREVLERSLADGSLNDANAHPVGGLKVLYNSADLTVLNVVWPPLFSITPHDHRMWAAIAVYGGREDNAFYRRQGPAIVSSGGKELSKGDVLLLGDDTIHAVANPARAYTGAIHVYGGDFVNTPRSQWDRETLTEAPYDLRAVQHEFDRAEQLVNEGAEARDTSR